MRLPHHVWRCLSPSQEFKFADNFQKRAENASILNMSFNVTDNTVRMTVSSVS
jgi:hypothetical protein